MSSERPSARASELGDHKRQKLFDKKHDARPVCQELRSLCPRNAKVINRSWITSCRPRFGGEQCPTALAVDCVALVLGKPAGGAPLEHSRGPDSTCTIRTNKLTPTIIIQDRKQPPRRPGKRDVAEPGLSQHRDREIKRIDIVTDRRVVPMLRFVNDRRRHKKEDEELGSRDNRIVIAPYEQEVTLHAAHDAI